VSKIIGVKFPYILKAQEFEAGDLDIKLHQFVITESSQGLELGQAVYEIKDTKEKIQRKDKDSNEEVGRLVRIATEADLSAVKEREQEAKDLFTDFVAKIEKHKLKMKPVGVSFSIDGSKVVYYFTADGRVDFRELAKDLSRSLKKQAILKQIGPRDEAKVIGGYGRCGLPVCCSTFLASSESITMSDAEHSYGMTKSASKISGVCGRLMCCIRFEEREEGSDVKSGSRPSKNI
jgi:cell fate regulator YaaT (PSP1 superfamily)